MLSVGSTGGRMLAVIPTASLILMMMAAAQPADAAAASALGFGKAAAASTGTTEAVVGEDTFLYQVDAAGNATLTGYEGTSARIVLPDSLDGRPVVAVATGAFKDVTTLTNLVVPEGYTSIASRAFEGCTALSKLDIDPTVATIADDAFVLVQSVQEQVTQGGKTETVTREVYENQQGFTLYGDPDSALPTFAQAHGHTFVQNRFHATAVTLNNTSVVLLNGIQTAQLAGRVDPENCTDKRSWSSDNSAVASVDANGRVVTAGLGTTSVRLTVGGVSAACSVQVVQPVTSISLNKQLVSVEAGQTKPLVATVAPDNAYNRNVVWSSSNPAVATVDANGVVTGVARGTTTVTCTAADGSGVTKTVEVQVDCSQVVATSVSQLESAHNSYASSSCDSWVYSVSGAAGLAVTFDKQTSVEYSYDFIEVYTREGAMVGSYTGTELAGQTVYVPGDSVRIRLVTDGSNPSWGFKVVGVDTYRPDGWAYFGGAQHYYIGGERLRGEVYVAGAWRYFDKDNGAMAVGITRLEGGKVKYYDEDGCIETGLMGFSDGWRYFDTVDGTMATGLTYLPDGRITYCDPSGIIQAGTYTFRGVKLHFNEAGMLDNPATTTIPAGTLAEEDGGPSAAVATQADKTALEAALGVVGGLRSDQYTPESWSLLVGTANAAVAVLGDVSASQALVDAHTRMIEECVAALAPAVVAPTVDATALQAAVDAASLLVATDYSEASWASLQATLSGARAILADTTASQSVVNAQLALVEAAVAGLQAPADSPAPAIVDKSALGAAIEAASTYTDGISYTAASWSAFQAALAGATAVRDDPNATQADVDAQTSLLTGATSGLTCLVEVSSYSGWTVADAQNDLVARGLVASVTYGATAPSAAENGLVYATSPENTMVDPGTTVTLTAYLDYVAPSTEALVDKTALETAIADVAWLTDGTYYSPASWSAFQAALASATAVRDNPAATQEEVDVQTTALRAAADGLVWMVDLLSYVGWTVSDAQYDVTALGFIPNVVYGDPAPSAAENGIVYACSPEYTTLEPGATVTLTVYSDYVAPEPEPEPQAETLTYDQRVERTEFLGALYLGALFKANVDDPANIPVNMFLGQTEFLDAYVGPGWGTYNLLDGNLLGFVANPLVLEEFMKNSLTLNADNPFGLGYTSDATGQKFIPYEVATQVFRGITGVDPLDVSGVYAPGLTAVEGGWLYDAPWDLKADVRCANAEVYDDGLTVLEMRISFMLDGATEPTVFYAQVTTMEDPGSVFGMHVVNIFVDPAYAASFGE